MKKLITILASILSLQSNAFETVEYRGRLVTNYQQMNREAAEGFNTLAIEDSKGGIHEIAIPAKEKMRFLKRFSGKHVIFEAGLMEGMLTPVALNMAIFLKDTQVTYWKNATEDFYKFPQLDANDKTQSDIIAGLVQFDPETVSDQASGFTITDKSKVYKVAKADRRLTYSLKALIGEVASFTIENKDTPPTGDSSGGHFMPDDLPGMNPFGIPHTWGRFGGSNVPFSSSVMDYNGPSTQFSTGAANGNAVANTSTSATAANNVVVNPIVEDAVTEENEPEEEVEVEKDLVRIETIIKPMQTGTVEGVATLSWDSGKYTLELDLGNEQKINMTYTKDFHSLWSNEGLSLSTIRVNYRVVIMDDGPYPMVESFKIIKQSEYEDNDDDYYGP